MIFQALSTFQTGHIIKSSERFREDNKEEQRYGVSWAGYFCLNILFEYCLNYFV